MKCIISNTKFFWGIFALSFSMLLPFSWSTILVITFHASHATLSMLSLFSPLITLGIASMRCTFYTITFLNINRVSYSLPCITLSTLLPFWWLIMLAIAFHTSHAMLSTLSLFSQSITLDITYLCKSWGQWQLWWFWQFLIFCYVIAMNKWCLKNFVLFFMSNKGCNLYTHATYTQVNMIILVRFPVVMFKVFSNGFDAFHHFSWPPIEALCKLEILLVWCLLR